MGRRAAAATWELASSLRPWAANPRENTAAVEPVARSIATLGFGAPLVVRKQGRTVIAGHTRLAAMAFLEANVLEEADEEAGGERLWRPRVLEQDGPFVIRDAPGPGLVPTRIVDLSDAEARALALADNRLGELAEWDGEGLERELRALVAEEFDLSGLGFDEDLAAFDEPTAPPGAPPAPPPPLPGTARILEGRCELRLRELDADSIDSCVCDPPYGLSEVPDEQETREILEAWLAGKPYTGRSKGFMGREWDAFVPGPEVWREIFRVLKPGAHVIAYSGSRTVDWLMLALRLAGFEVRDKGEWCYWSGFPKSLNVALEIDTANGVEPTVLGLRGDTVPAGHAFAGEIHGSGSARKAALLTAPTSDDAKTWSGWGTGLKPALEPWVLARKPLGRSGKKPMSVAASVVKRGTGAINIDGCRFRPDDPMWPGPTEGLTSNVGDSGSSVPTSYELGEREPMQTPGQRIGRWPANLLYCPKPSRAEREAGCGHLTPTTREELTGRKVGSAGSKNPRASTTRRGEIRNTHPTLKPIRLLAWQVRLVTPPGGTVLDPFSGSGSVGCAAIPQGFSLVACEIDPTYVRISEARIGYWSAVGLSALPGWDEPEEPEET